MAAVVTVGPSGVKQCAVLLTLDEFKMVCKVATEAMGCHSMCWSFILTCFDGSDLLKAAYGVMSSWGNGVPPSLSACVIASTSRFLPLCLLSLSAYHH